MRRKPKRKPKPSTRLTMDDSDEDSEDDEEEDDDEDDEEIAIGRKKKAAPRGPPSLLRVLRANVIIFLYTLPINAFSILLLYGVTTMALGEFINAQVR